MAALQPKSLAVRCPKCDAAFEIGIELAGQQGRCRCGHVFPLQPDASADVATAPPKRELPVQYVGVSCRVCQTRMFGRPDQVGRALKCPDCGAVTVLPAPTPEKPKPPPAALEGEQYELWDVDAAPPNSALLAAQPKYIAVECRVCQTLMYATPEQVGKKVRCPDCRTVHVVPPPEKPKRTRSALVPDEEGYELEEAPVLTVPPPVIVPPRRPMLYEEERDAELERQSERRAQGKTSGPQYDVYGRPILPRWPLLTRIVPFLFSRGVPARWLVLSIGLLVVMSVLAVGISTIRPTGGIQATGIAVIGGVCLFLFAVVIGVLWLAAMSSTIETIVTESSEGNDSIQQWPPPNAAEWVAPMLAVVVAALVSAFPGWLAVQLLSLSPDWTVGDLLENRAIRAAVVTAGLLVGFPIVYLSQLDIGSMFGVFSVRVLASVAKCPFSWLLFYIEVFALAGMCVGVLLLAPRLGPAMLLVEIPLVVVAMFLGARLLGRLAWKLAESMPVEENASRDGWAR